jgi:hypothetical protein
MLASFSWAPAFATEGGGGAYPNGCDNFVSGALPPPGTYFLDYATYYTANKFRGENGDGLIPDFKIHAIANVFRFVHVTNHKVLGGNWGMHIAIPIVHLDVTAGGRSQNRTSIGDTIIDPFVFAWHAKNWHWLTGLEVLVPVGSYDTKDLANIGRNYWTFEPIFAATYLSDSGFEVSVKFLYDINTKNNDTNYKSGQEFHIDYTVAKKFNNISAGLGGYYYKQISDDEQYGIKVAPDGKRGQVFAIGPQVKYDFKKMFLVATYATEMSVKNRPDGDKFWLKFFYPF